MNTNENNISKDIFRLLGVLIVAIFSIAFGLLRMLGDSKDSLGVPEDDYNNLSSASLRALSNPNNLNHDD